MSIRSWGAISPFKTLFSDTDIIGQLINWIIDQIYEIELGCRNGFDWSKRRAYFRPTKVLISVPFSPENRLSKPIFYEFTIS